MSKINTNKCGEYLIISHSHHPTTIISLSKSKNKIPNKLEIWKIGSSAIKVRLSKQGS